VPGTVRIGISEAQWSDGHRSCALRQADPSEKVSFAPPQARDGHLLATLAVPIGWPPATRQSLAAFPYRPKRLAASVAADPPSSDSSCATPSISRARPSPLRHRAFMPWGALPYGAARGRTDRIQTLAPSRGQPRSAHKAGFHASAIPKQKGNGRPSASIQAAYRSPTTR
jgi:hypothetical protein